MFWRLAPWTDAVRVHRPAVEIGRHIPLATARPRSRDAKRIPLRSIRGHGVLKRADPENGGDTLQHGHAFAGAAEIPGRYAPAPATRCHETPSPREESPPASARPRGATPPRTCGNAVRMLAIHRSRARPCACTPPDEQTGPHGSIRFEQTFGQGFQSFSDSASISSRRLRMRSRSRRTERSARLRLSLISRTV